MNRKEQVEALVPTVRDEEEGRYSVESSDGSGWRYLCRPKTETSPATCDCQDQRRHRAAQPGYRCKHMLAIRAYLKAQKAAAQPVKPVVVPTQEKAMNALEKRTRAMAEVNTRRLAALTPVVRYESARQQIEDGNGDAFSEAEALDAWLESLDDEEDIPHGLAFVEA